MDTYFKDQILRITVEFRDDAGDLADISVGVGVGGAAADDHQTDVVQRHIAKFGIGALNRLAHPLACCRDHFGIDGKLAAVLYGDAVLGGIGVQHCRDVVFGDRPTCRPLSELYVGGSAY